MFDKDPNNQNRRPMNDQTNMDRRTAMQTASKPVPIALAAVFIVAIMIGVFVMSGPNTETANNTGQTPSIASRASSTTGLGTGR
jgi:hypothetical protein